MSRQSPIISGVESTVSDLLAARKRHEMLLFIVLFITLFSFTPLFILLGTKTGFSVLLGGAVALALALAIVRWPIVGLYTLAAGAFLIEQEALTTPIFTDHLYVFYWPPQLQGFFERPIGLLILLAFFAWLLHRLLRHERFLRGGALWYPFLLYMLCVVGGALYGFATGGNLKIIVVELRPFWYMFTSYLLAYNFITRRSHIRAFFWLVIASAGVKALQGLYVYLIVNHGSMVGHDTIMSHEESFFFAALLLLVVIFSLHYRYRPQLIAALCVAPMVVIAMIANQRRTDYIALLLGIGVAWVLIFQVKPQARTRLLILMIICAGLGTAYVLAFQNSLGSLGQPARAIISVFKPSASDVRDASSNLYRIFEDNDLKYTVKQYPLGLGFGKPFLQPQPLTSIFPGILAADPYYNYVPHNTIYWIWTDLGPIGYFSLWFLFGSIIIMGCIITRKLRDPYLQVVSIYIVAITMMEVVVAFADYQLFFYRNVIYLGLLCGILVKLPVLDKQNRQKQEQETKDVPANELTDGVSTPSHSFVGSRHA
jgi:O-Antigen ligase